MAFDVWVREVPSAPGRAGERRLRILVELWNQGPTPPRCRAGWRAWVRVGVPDAWWLARPDTGELYAASAAGHATGTGYIVNECRVTKAGIEDAIGLQCMLLEYEFTQMAVWLAAAYPTPARGLTVPIDVLALYQEYRGWLATMMFKYRCVV